MYIEVCDISVCTEWVWVGRWVCCTCWPLAAAVVWPASVVLVCSGIASPVVVWVFVVLWLL